MERISIEMVMGWAANELVQSRKRLLWVSPGKSFSIPLQKIVMFEPYLDGIKVIKDTGNPLLFVFEHEDQAGMVKISRVIEELR